MACIQVNSNQAQPRVELDPGPDFLVMGSSYILAEGHFMVAKKFKHIMCH